MMRDVVWKTLEEVLDRNKFPYKLHKAEWRLELPEFDATILLRSADKPDRLKGLNLAWFILDEAAICEKDAWNVLLSRSRAPGASIYQGCITTTPEGLNWVYEEFEEKQRDDYEIIYSPTTDNKYLSDDYVRTLIESYDEKTAAQYIEGRFTNIGVGLIYHAFDRNTHIKEHEYNPAHVVHVGIDFNVAPMCAEIFQVLPDKTIVGIDEIVIDDNASTQEMCNLIKKKYGETLKHGRLWLYPDAAGSARRTSGISDHLIMKNALPGAVFRQGASNPRVKDRINAVNGQLRNAEGTICLYLSPKQVELKKDFEMVSWNDKGEDIDKAKDARRTHASDAAGYVVEKLRPIRRNLKTQI